jgi:integrase
MTVDDALSLWITYRGRMRELGLCAASTLTNQSLIVMQLRGRIGARELSELRKSDLELYIGERMKTCCAVTIRGEMNVVRQWLNWCVDEAHLVVKPRVPTVTVAAPEDALPSDEAFACILAIVPPACSRGLEFMMLTGLSPHELERLQVRDGGFQRIGIGQREGFHVKQEVRRRWVPLNGRAQEIWNQSTMGMMPETHPFPKRDAMQKAIKRAVADLLGPQFVEGYPLGLQAMPPKDIERVTPKSMRSWFASKLSAPGINGEPTTPEKVLQRLMGHAPGSPITRKHYIRSTDAEGVAALDRLTT